MRRIVGIVTVVLFAAMLCAPVCWRVLVRFTESGELSNMVEGGGPTTEFEGGLEGILSGNDQVAIDERVGKWVPFRDELLLLTAALQRSLITIADAPFGYESYPTYYGSEYLELPGVGAILPMPDVIDEGVQEKTSRAAEAITDAVDDAPDGVRWFFYLVDKASTSQANPSRSLMGGEFADYAFYRNALLAELPDGCILVDGGYEDAQAFFSDYYLTDHHWQIGGAVNAYRKIASAMGFEPADVGTMFPIFEGEFFGSSARNGADVDEADEVVYDVAFNLEDVSVTIDGEQVPANAIDYAAGDSSVRFVKKAKLENLYAECFHNDFGLIVLENPSISDGTLLIVGDSYSNSMERFFTSHYRRVVVADHRYGAPRVADLIRQYSVDDVLLLVCADRLADEEFLAAFGYSG